MENRETKYFRHYKNKSYKFLGIAHHSETLEEVVVYETLYKNDLNSLWVRPKEIFFSEIELNGEKTLRFKPVEFKFTDHKIFPLKIRLILFIC